MARKPVPVECINKNNCIFKKTEQQQLLLDLKKDHIDFRQSIQEFTKTSADIAVNTKELANVLKDFREDSREHLKMIADLNANSQEHLKLIAGKRQVPITVFILITATLCGLLVATEVKYSGVSIELTWSDGLKITNNNSKN